jgi:hypothetical protein
LEAKEKRGQYQSNKQTNTTSIPQEQHPSVPDPQLGRRWQPAEEKRKEDHSGVGEQQTTAAGAARHLFLVEKELALRAL